MCDKVDDKFARKVESLWKEYYEDATLLPIVGIPSTGGGVGLLTHTMGDDMKMLINNLKTLSPIANNALYSFEASQGKFINLYETMIPDMPGHNGSKSTGQIYLNALRDNGLDVAGVHFHWTGGTMHHGDKLVLAVHHQKINMDPLDFTRRTIKSLQEVMMVVDERVKEHNDMHPVQTSCSCSHKKNVAVSDAKSGSNLRSRSAHPMMVMPAPSDSKMADMLTDSEALATLAVWKRALPDSLLLPGIGLPSQNSGVLTLTHTFGNNKLLNIDGLASKSPLSNNALYTSERSEGKYINLYEVLVPDIPGVKGAPSTSQIYIDTLAREGLNVSAVHFHWTGSTVFPEDLGVVAIHHYNIGMTPVDFSNRTIRALVAAATAIKARTMA